MLDTLLLLSLYIWEGCMQGIAFETVPALLRKNPWAVSNGQSDDNERILNYSEIPFQIKWLLCFVVECKGPVRQFHSRESKLVALLFVSGCALLACLGRRRPVFSLAGPESRVEQTYRNQAKHCTLLSPRLLRSLGLPAVWWTC